MLPSFLWIALTVLIGVASPAISPSSCDWIPVWSNILNRPVDVVALSVSSSHEYIIACERHSGVVNFLRVLRYPNLYQDKTHLLYGIKSVFSNISTCILSADQGVLAILDDEMEQQQLRLFRWYELNGVDHRERMINRRFTESADTLLPMTNFRIVHPRDHFDEVWLNGTEAHAVMAKVGLDDLRNKESAKNNEMMTKISLSSKGSGERKTVWGQKALSASSPSGRYLAVLSARSELVLLDTRANSDNNNSGNQKMDVRGGMVVGLWFESENEVVIAMREKGILLRVILQDEGTWKMEQQRGSNPLILLAATNSGSKKHALLQLSENHIIEIAVTSKSERIVEKIPELPWEEQGLYSIAFTVDGNTLFVGCSTSTKVVVLTGERYERHNVIVLPKQQAGVTALATYAFERDYVVIGTKNALLAYSSQPKNPCLDDKCRIGDFYLPPAPPLNDHTNIEVSGIFTQPLFYVAMLVAIIVFSSISRIKRIETSCFHRLPSGFCNFVSRVLYSNMAFDVSCLGLFLFSLFEVVVQPPFVNDWPAHLHHVEQWIVDGVTDYDDFMHYHGPCTYAGGFMWLYGLLFVVFRGSLQCYQLLWAILEVILLRSLRQLCLLSNASPLAWWLPLFSNRLHLYNVRVVVNDLPPTLLGVAAILNARKGHWKLCTLLFSLALCQKLNFILWGPSMALVYLTQLGWKSSILHGLAVALVQLLISFPFAMADVYAYVSLAYDLSRVFLWDKTRTFRWVGRRVYALNQFNMVLGIIGTLIVVIGLWRCRKSLMQKNQRIVVVALLWSNFVFCATARGMFTPFMSWFAYYIPLLCSLMDMPHFFVILIWILYEVFWRVLGSHTVEMWTSYVLFLTNSIICFHFLSWARTLNTAAAATTTTNQDNHSISSTNRQHLKPE